MKKGWEREARIVLKRAVEGSCAPGRKRYSVTLNQGYTRWARTYDRDPNPLLRLEERTLGPLVPDLRGKTVLDLACGTGRWFERLLSKGARWGAGLDLSEAMLSGAGAKTPLHGRLARGDFLALPFRPGFADLVICSFAVNHTAGLAALAREMARVARPQAHVFVSDLHPRAQARGWECAFSSGAQTLVIGTVAHSLGQIQRAFAREEFELLNCQQPCLGEPEREIFSRAGKSRVFAEACKVPAVFIFHFKRRSIEAAGHGGAAMKT